MRFKWSRSIVLTALTAVFLLPMAGCSSGGDQQAASDPETQGQGEAQGEQGEQGAAPAQGQAAAEAPAQGEGGDEVAATEQSTNAEAEVPQENIAEGNEPSNVVANNTAQSAIDPVAQDAEAINAAMATGDPAPAEPVAAVPVEPAPVADVASAPQAAAPAGVAGVPEEGSKMPYVIEVGDTLSKVATKIYGDQKRWRDIASLSGISNPNHIFPGDLVYYNLDNSSQTFASSYEAVRRAKETVQTGDTLASIARRVYGSSSLWRHIWRQNDTIENPDQLTAGTTIYYVEKGSVKSAQIKTKAAHSVKLVKVSKSAKSKLTANQHPTHKNVQKVAFPSFVGHTARLI